MKKLIMVGMMLIACASFSQTSYADSGGKAQIFGAGAATCGEWLTR